MFKIGDRIICTKIAGIFDWRCHIGMNLQEFSNLEKGTLVKCCFEFSKFKIGDILIVNYTNNIFKYISFESIYGLWPHQYFSIHKKQSCPEYLKTKMPAKKI